MSTPPEGRRSRGSGRHQRIRGATSAPRGERYRDATLRQDHYGRSEARNTRDSGGVPRQSGIETASGGLPSTGAAAQRSQESPSDRQASDAVQTTGGSPDFAAGGVSAEYFAEISRLADTTGTGAVGDIQSEIRRGSAAAGTGVSPEVQEASETERRHEIIALGESRLVLNLGNWRRFRETAIRERDRQTLVVSCLGDTSAGKSHTILSLLGAGEEGPYCPPTGAAQGATTFNVNLYQSRTYHPKVTVNFVDYEGENGSDTPSMAAVRSLHNAGPSNVARHTAVRDYFPTLAYTTSDVVIVISREPFTNRQYLSRCVELSKRANRGVQNVDRPALVLVGNKLPGQECHFKVEKSTLQFFRTWGKQAAKLDEFFSAVFCFYLPHRGSAWMEPASLAEANGTAGAEAPTMPGSPRQVSGEKMFRRQLRKIRAVLEGFARERFSKSSGDVVRSGLGSLDGAGDPSGAKTPAEVLGKLGGGELGGSARPSDLDGSAEDRESGLSASSGAGGSVGDASSEGGSSVKSEAAARRERELASMHRPRLLTQQSTLWYSLLPAVLRELNNGRGVDVTRLIDQAWARQLVTVKAGDENDVDAIHALNTFVAPDPSLSDASQFPELERLWRYRARRAMMLDVAVRLAACRLRWLDPSVLVPEKTTRFAERLLRKSRELLDSLAPCCALYDTEGASTTASERPGKPVLCLQERRSHSVHRTCRTVTGGKGIFGLPNFYFIPYNDTWTGEFKAPTDDALDRLERKFRSGTRGKALVAPRPTLLGTRAGEEAEEEAVARGDMTELTSAVDVLLAGSGVDGAAGSVGDGDGDGDGGVARGGVDGGAGDRDPGIGSAVPFSTSSPSISSSSATSSQAGSGSGVVAPAVPLGRRTSREPSVRSQVKEVLALVRLSDREFLEELLRFQERHTTALACVGFVPIRRGRRRDIERGVVPGLREGSMGDAEGGGDSSDSDSDSESDSGSEMGAGGAAGDDDVGDSRGPGSDGLLRPCDPVQDQVHARLRLLSTLPASIWVPYCLGCGVKVEGRGASGSLEESGGDGLGDLGEDLGGSGSGGGLMGGISDLFSWMVGAGAGGSGEGEGAAGSEVATMSMQRQMKSLSLGSSGSGGGSGWSDGAGAGSGDAEDMAVALSSSEGPSAVGGLGRGAGAGPEGSQGSGYGSGNGSSSLDGSPIRGSGSPGRSVSGPTRQNVWLGLCKRCWRASYLEPVYREAARRRGRGAPADGSGADCPGSEGGRFD